MTPHPTPCGCCGGGGKVEAYDGTTRPCSRCREAEFRVWAHLRRPKAPPAMILPIPPGGDAA